MFFLSHRLYRTCRSYHSSCRIMHWRSARNLLAGSSSCVSLREDWCGWCWQASSGCSQPSSKCLQTPSGCSYIYGYVYIYIYIYNVRIYIYVYYTYIYIYIYVIYVLYISYRYYMY